MESSHTTPEGRDWAVPGDGGGVRARLKELGEAMSPQAVAAAMGLPERDLKSILSVSGPEPTAPMLASACMTLGISADWLLLGIGPRLKRDQIPWLLQHADPADLQSAVRPRRPDQARNPPPSRAGR